MGNSVQNSRYAQAINVNPMSLYTPDSIFSSNILSPVYSDMYIPSRSLDKRTMDKYERPEHMWTQNKKLALIATIAYGAVGLFTKGRSIKATGKLLVNIGERALDGIQKIGSTLSKFVSSKIKPKP